MAFLIGSYIKSKTVYAIAERIKPKGNEIILIFLDDEPLLNNQLTKFADSIYLLKKDLNGEKSVQGIKSIGYSELISILEKSDKVVSWT